MNPAMNEASILALATLAGGALGTIFFGGLWWTIRGALASNAPALWFFGSFTLRTGIALGGFFLATRGDWRNAMMCLLGFLAARGAVSRLTRTRTHSASTP
jgi:F1F0 ATPase subunit 2